MVAAAKSLNLTLARSAMVDRIVAEQLSSGSISLRIDEEHGVIHGCKIAGFQSGNKARTLGLTRDQVGDASEKPYRYSRRAFENAVSIYEGASVYSNHLPFAYDERGQRYMAPQDMRVNESLLGWFENVKVGDDGAYGDFHYVKSHPLSSVVVEVARRRPSKFKFSHEALWDEPTIDNGQVVLNKITAVHAIALVCVNAGTTQSLFESLATPIGETIMPRTMRQVLEALADTTKGRKELMEMIGSPDYQTMGDMPVETPAEASAEEQISAAFEGALIAVWRDKKLDVQAKIAKVKDLFKALEKVSGDGTAPAGGEAKPEGEAKSEEKKAEESLATNPASALWQAAKNGTGTVTSPAAVQPVTTQTVVDRAPLVIETVALLTGAGLAALTADQTVIESLLALPDKAARENWIKAVAGTRTLGIGEPKSGAAAPAITAPPTKQVAETKSVDPKDFAAMMRGVKAVPSGAK